MKTLFWCVFWCMFGMLSMWMLIKNTTTEPPPHHRSRAAVAQFKKLHPCPATGKSLGSCPGWIIDHVIPLACGGPDAPANMQWQTYADAKAKDKWERKGCSTK